MPGEKILVVDDDQNLRQGLGIRLKANGYQVLFAADAASAVRIAKEKKPDLIILDLVLPDTDGFGVLEQLKATIPVIILTAKDAMGAEKRARKAGAVAFFHKPVDNDVFLSTIEKILGK